MGWYPDHLTSAKQELALPETSGHLLTTGNLRDVTIEAGELPPSMQVDAFRTLVREADRKQGAHALQM
jgi:hypothetical protein